MEIKVCKDYDEMSRTAAALAADSVRQHPEGLISFPAGDTPVGMVEDFVRRVQSGEVDISGARYVSLDEWVGLTDQDPGACAYFNRKYLLEPLTATPFASAHIINGAAKDPEAERLRLLDYLAAYGPLALSVLGVGMNGHLGFNEDGVDFEQDAIVIPLSPTTKTVMKKYFGENAHPEYGISIGVRQLMAAEKVVLIANGEKKADIMARTVKGPVTNEVPSSILQRHPNCTVVLDEAAAAGL